MQHSVKYIAMHYELLSNMRKENNSFNANTFFQFAKDNKTKYNIIENGDDLLVNTFYCDFLINDYKLTIYNNINYETIQ